MTVEIIVPSSCSTEKEDPALDRASTLTFKNEISVTMSTGFSNEKVMALSRLLS